jgi:hypothetical protein
VPCDLHFGLLGESICLVAFVGMVRVGFGVICERLSTLQIEMRRCLDLVGKLGVTLESIVYIDQRGRSSTGGFYRSALLPRSETVGCRPTFIVQGRQFCSNLASFIACASRKMFVGNAVSSPA